MQDQRALQVATVYKDLLGYRVHQGLRAQPDRMDCQVQMDQ